VALVNLVLTGTTNKGLFGTLRVDTDTAEGLLVVSSYRTLGKLYIFQIEHVNLIND
jgi:hypothetical protein